jgi:hypothetical protein
MNLLSELIGTNETYTHVEVIIYLLGAFSWFLSYALVVRKILLEKFVEYPILAITANVVWEVLWGFVFELAFGGHILLVLWRLGTFLDIFMFYSVLRYGKVQVSVEFVRQNYIFVMLFAAACSGFIIYTFVKTGYDLPMGINSGMILNLMMAVLSLFLFWQMPERKFSFWIGFWRFLGTDVFFTIYIFILYPNLSFPITLCVINILLDGLYLVLVYRRRNLLINKQQ